MAQVVYESNQRIKLGWVKTWILLFNNILNSRELIFQLFKRDFLMSYKKSFLGMAWIFITPLMGIFSWVFYNATGILSPGDVGIPYPAYVLISTMIYGLWGNFQSAAVGTLDAGSGFITQVNYPHDVLLIKQAMIQLSNFIVSFIPTLVVLLFFGVTPSWMIVLLPFLILPLFFLGSSIGLLISLIKVVSPDIQTIMNFSIGLLIYITPVIYSPKVDNAFLQTVIKYNPLTYIIGGVRDAIIYGNIPNFGYFAIFSGVTFILFLVSWRIFYVSEMKVIEKMI